MSVNATGSPFTSTSARGLRIAAISDIHGNIHALEAVLADIEHRQVDVVVNLGDILSGPLFPSETADLLMQANFPTVKGNHERHLLTLPFEAMSPTDRFTWSSLRVEHFEWMADLPTTMWLTPEVFLCHGTPDNDLTYLLEALSEDGCGSAPREQIAPHAESCTAQLLFCGQSHLQRAVRLSDDSLVVNPGSVGLQAYSTDPTLPFPHRVEPGSPHARYAIAEQASRGWTAELIEVEYDWEAAAIAAYVHGREDWSKALRSGPFHPRSA